MPTSIILIDDKHVPIHRVMWVSDLPHYCGDEECQCEGQYEIRLEQGESLFGSREDRDRVIETLEQWLGEPEDPEDSESWEE